MHVNDLYTTNEYGIKYPDLQVAPDAALVQKYKQEHNITTHITEQDGSLTPVHPMCLGCQIRHINDKGKFRVACNFVRGKLPKSSLSNLQAAAAKADVDPNIAKKIALSKIDPVARLELMFGFGETTEKESSEIALYHYQKEVIRCTANNIVLDQGRRTGKTFSIVTKILDIALHEKRFAGRSPITGKPLYVGHRILVLAPFSKQLDEFFKEAETLLRRNPELEARVATNSRTSLYSQTPFYEMAFKDLEDCTGAIITGMVTGVSLKGDSVEGGSIRGSKASILYIDEVDMIPDSIIEKVITPLKLQPGGCRTFVSSTPIGKRAKFYHWVKVDETYRTFELPATVLPTFDKIREEVEKSSKEAFLTDYMAQFIDGTYGVFKPSLIQECRRNYTYNDASLEAGEFWYKLIGHTHPRKQIIICIGIDWNDTAGTEIFVTAFIPSHQVYVGLDAINIPGSEFTSHKLKDEILKLNYKWQPDYIYADKGYGHHIIDDLKYIAHSTKAKPEKNLMDLQTIELSKRLKSFEFGGNLEIRDPVTKEIKTVPGKAFLVQNAVEILEDKKFIMPHDEETLRVQMGNYILLKRLESGKPVYGQNNNKIGDHRLDAWMLSLVGLVLEESLFSAKTRQISKPAFIELFEQVTKNREIETPKHQAPKLVKDIDIDKITQQPQAIWTRQNRKDYSRDKIGRDKSNKTSNRFWR